MKVKKVLRHEMKFVARSIWLILCLIITIVVAVCFALEKVSILELISIIVCLIISIAIFCLLEGFSYQFFNDSYKMYKALYENIMLGYRLWFMYQNDVEIRMQILYQLIYDVSLFDNLKKELMCNRYSKKYVKEIQQISDTVEESLQQISACLKTSNQI